MGRNTAMVKFIAYFKDSRISCKKRKNEHIQRYFCVMWFHCGVLFELNVSRVGRVRWGAHLLCSLLTPVSLSHTHTHRQTHTHIRRQVLCLPLSFTLFLFRTYAVSQRLHHLNELGVRGWGGTVAGSGRRQEEEEEEEVELKVTPAACTTCPGTREQARLFHTVQDPTQSYLSEPTVRRRKH